MTSRTATAATTVWALTHVGVAIAFALLLSIFALLEPVDGGVRWRWATRPLPELCQRFASTGRPCAGCGVTRGIVSAMRGDFAAAGRHHPGALALLLLSLAQVVVRPLVARLAPKRREAIVCGVLDWFGHLVVVWGLIERGAS